MDVLTETNHIHPTIQTVREGQAAGYGWIFRTLTLSDRIRAAFEDSLPMLWALEHDDATGMPQEVYDFMRYLEEVLQIDLGVADLEKQFFDDDGTVRT